MSPARARYTQLARAQLGKPVLWASKGPDAFDCSGLVTWTLHAIGGIDLRATHNAQKLHDESHALLLPDGNSIIPAPGDLIFYGHGKNAVEHVAIWLEGDKAISADGATSKITKLEIALANPANRVRLHDAIGFRRDLPYLAVHRNVRLDAVDAICL